MHRTASKSFRHFFFVCSFCKSLGPHINSLYFARKIGNIYSDLLKCANINVNTVDKAGKEFVQLQALGGIWMLAAFFCILCHTLLQYCWGLGSADTNPWMTVSDCVFSMQAGFYYSKSAVVSSWSLLKKLSRFQLSAFQILLREGLKSGVIFDTEHERPCVLQMTVESHPLKMTL